MYIKCLSLDQVYKYTGSDIYILKRSPGFSSLTLNTETVNGSVLPLQPLTVC